MATLCQYYISPRKVLLFYLFLSLFASVLVCASYSENQFLGSRKMLEMDDDDGGGDDPPIKKKSSTSSVLSSTKTLIKSKSTTISTKNQTKLIKPSTNPPKNQTKSAKSPMSGAESKTKLLKLPSDSTKNKTKLNKPTSDSTKEMASTLKTQLKKLNSTSKSAKSLNSPNSAKPSSVPAKTPSDLKKTTKSNSTKLTKTQLGINPNDPISQNPNQNQTKDKKPKSQKPPKPTQPSWIDQEDEYDLVSEFRDLPTKFQETLLPDLEKISTTSKVYLNRANKEITKGFKPIVGKKYAPTIASIVSCAFILIPLILVSLIFNQIKAYFSLQKLLIFIQVYLSIYFSILCLSSLVTGIEPLRFFYAASQSTYVCLQALQTIGYVLYLILLLVYFVLVFSTETGLGLKVLSLGQMLVGLAVGLHYYVTVFHRMVLRQPPKTSWRTHGIYATCFLFICLLARAERRKKAYLEDGGEEGKKS